MKEDNQSVLFKLTHVFPKKYLFIIGLIITIVTSFIEISFSYFLKVLLDATLDKNTDQFFSLLYVFIGMIIFNLILIYLAKRLLGYYTEGGILALRNLLTQKITKIKQEHLSKSHSGDYISRATNDMNNVRNFTFNTLPELIKQPLLAISALCLLFYLSWKLTLIILFTIPVLFIGISLLNKPIHKISKKRQEKLAKVNAYATDYIKGVEVSKAYTIEDVIKSKYDHEVDQTAFYGKRLEFRFAVVQSFSLIMTLAPFFVIFIVGGYFVSQKEVSIGTLLAFISLLNYITNPMSAIPRLIAQFSVDKASIHRVFDIIQLEEEREDGLDFDLIDNSPFIEFKNVSFSYPGQENKLFDELSLKINLSESIALVGPSGGGKSTISKLLLGFYDNYEGEIFIGGHELNEWSLKSLRKYIGYVSQDTFLFPETIRENIQYGNLKATDEEVIACTKLANAHGFITEFKDKYDTKVGELGGTLSGGQKQRLSIARSMLKNAPILLLDEATSALDNESEALVQKALENSLKGKTSIIIAHRLSTIKNVDRIIVLKEGKIVEEGTHDALLLLNGHYRQLYEKQFIQKQVQKEDEVNEQFI